MSAKPLTPQKLQEWFRNNDFYSPKILKNEQTLYKLGNKRALQLFHAAAKRVPAYKDFLKKNKINSEIINSVKDYEDIPPTTKENYIQVYPLEKRVWDGTLKKAHMISSSSGTTGELHYWPRSLEHEIEGALLHEFILKNIFHSDTISTLFINGFALGNWIAGTFTSICVNLVSWKRYPITLMSPGYSLEEVLKTIHHIGSFYEQIIITGHVPFLKEIVDSLIKNDNISVKKIRLLGTGQAITERWREYIIKQLQATNYYHSVLNLYGSADASLMGFETPLSIYIRKILHENTSLLKDLLGTNRLPSFYNYDPRLIFFEEQEGELLITKNSGVPLIRYNIHDEGGILSYYDTIRHITSNGYKIKKEILNWHFPFVYLYGRDKFMVKIYGANVYSEQVQHALSHEKLQSHITGRYKLEIEYDKEHNTHMICHIELNNNIKPSKELLSLIKKIFVEEVRQINSEFNDVLNRMGERANPIIITYPYGYPKYFPKGKVKKNA